MSGGSGPAAAAARRAALSRRAALACLALATAVAAVWLLKMDSHLTFIADDWELVVKRQGWGASDFLTPFHGSLIVGLVAVYRVLQETFGTGSATPHYVVAIAAFLSSAALLFFYLRRRVGDWFALLGAILILFLGAGFEDLLFAFQLGYFASVAAGLGMLLALDREDDAGDRLACLLLTVSLAFSSIGLAFALGALVNLALGRRPRGRRAYVALAPIALYGVWWLGWGHSGESHVSVHNLATTPEFVFKAAAAGITSLLGLATGDGSEPSQPHLIWGKLILVAGLILLVVRIVRERRVPRGLAVALAIGLALWIVTGANRDVSRLPTSSRYQYPSAVFLLLIAAEMVSGLRSPRRARELHAPRLLFAAGAVVTGLAVAGGISLIDREYHQRWRPYADSLRSTLGGLEIAGTSSDPRFQVSFPPDLTASALAYFTAAERHGSPAFGETRLAAQPQERKGFADLTIAQALGLALGPPAPSARTIACQTLRASAAGSTGITLRHGGFALTNRSPQPVEIGLGRFAEGFPVSLGPLPAGGTTALTIPTDESPRPWNLGLLGAGPVRLCTTETTG